jgi:hypothetical protein
VLITLPELTCAVEWIHNPDAICTQPRLVICGLLGEDRVVWKCSVELTGDQPMRTLVTFVA